MSCSRRRANCAAAYNPAMIYLALVRGINVGGNSMIRMRELKEALECAGFANVTTYIQSGNVIFTAPRTGVSRLVARIEAAIAKTFALKVGVAIFSAADWQEVVRNAQKWWGS